MLETHYLYTYLMLFTLSYPLAQSFEWRINYYTKWKHLIFAIGAIMLIFIPWDIWKNEQGVWWFNDKYIIGYRLFGLPLEEWSFFVLVPFACVFLYEVLLFYVKKDILKSIYKPVLLLLIALMLVVGFLNLDKLYTSISFLFTAFVTSLVILRDPTWLSRFLLAYLVTLLPFLLINGALTGLFTHEALVNYNPEEFLGLRIFTIPIEDSVYGFSMLLITVWVYEWRKTRRG
jgi:lycopene cyclase domain-containing protein